MRDFIIYTAYIWKKFAINYLCEKNLALMFLSQWSWNSCIICLKYELRSEVNSLSWFILFYIGGLYIKMFAKLVNCI